VALPATSTSTAASSASSATQGTGGALSSSAPVSLLASLIVVMQLNVCRCWIATGAGCEKIVALARSEEGPNGWLSVLSGVDAESAQKKADSLFRLMFKAAQQFTQGNSTSLFLKLDFLRICWDCWTGGFRLLGCLDCWIELRCSIQDFRHWI